MSYPFNEDTVYWPTAPGFSKSTDFEGVTDKADEVITVLEALINDVVLLSLGLFFLISIETRIKRKRTLAAIHELRSIAHVIDMHQLTKDPAAGPRGDTASSPKRTENRYELKRYLDYCSELLALTGKLAALYVQEFNDDVAVAAVNEVENLTTGLARKVWQKIMILHAYDDTDLPGAPEGAQTSGARAD